VAQVLDLAHAGEEDEDPARGQLRVDRTDLARVRVRVRVGVRVRR